MPTPWNLPQPLTTSPNSFQREREMKSKRRRVEADVMILPNRHEIWQTIALANSVDCNIWFKRSTNIKWKCKQTISYLWLPPSSISDIFTLLCLGRMYLMSLVQSGTAMQLSIFDAATALKGREETNLQLGTLLHVLVCKPAFCIPLFSSRSLFLYLHDLYSKFFRHTCNASYISNQYYNLISYKFYTF